MNRVAFPFIILGICLSFQGGYQNNLGAGTDDGYYGCQESTLEEKLPVVPQKAFYKDVFLDAGVGLTSRKFLYAARYLNMLTEGISFSRSNASGEEVNLQNSIVAGDESDTNGRLLYPDGQPRYRLLFVNVCRGFFRF